MSLHFIVQRVIIFHTFCVLISLHWKNAPIYIFLRISKWKFPWVKHTFWVRFRWVFNALCWNLEKMFLDNQGEKQVSGNFYFFCFFSKLTILVKRMHVLWKVSKRHSDVDRVLPLKSDRQRTWSVNLGALGNRALYLKNLNFLILIEGLRAKRAYIEFWPIFIFCRLTCFDMKSIIL